MHSYVGSHLWPQNSLWPDACTSSIFSPHVPNSLANDSDILMCFYPYWTGPHQQFAGRGQWSSEFSTRMVSTRLLPILFCGIIALVMRQTRAEARFSPNNPEDVEEIEEELTHEDDDEEGELDLEEEVFGTKVKRFNGINIINEELEAVIVDPSEHVLRALSSPEEKNNALTLEKVKAMYKEQQEKEAKEYNAKNTRDIASLNFEEIMKRETQAKEQEESQLEEQEEGLYDKMINLFW